MHGYCHHLLVSLAQLFLKDSSNIMALDVFEARVPYLVLYRLHRVDEIVVCDHAIHHIHN